VIIEVDVLPGETPDGRFEVEVLSDAYRPADNGLVDSRELGVVLSSLAFEPYNGDF
jgi:hypothetical protein